MNDDQLEYLLIAVVKYCLKFGDIEKLEESHPNLHSAVLAAQTLRFAVKGFEVNKTQITKGFHALNHLDCNEVKDLKEALRIFGFKNHAGEHRDLLSLASSYAKIPEQQVNAAQQEITADERLLLASQNFSFALDLFIHHKEIAANEKMHMEKVLEIVWKYNIFTDYLNNNDAFSPHMNWDQFVDCLHNFCVEQVSHIRPPMDEPPAPAAPAMLTAYNNQQSSSSSSSSSTSLSNDNVYFEATSSVASLRK